MTDVELTEDQHRALAREMLARWQDGESKSRLEVEYWDNPTSHGKAFSAYIRRWRHTETEHRSAQTERITELESRLRVHGISPDEGSEVEEEYQLLAVCREAALAALRVYNDPTAGFRTETFAVLMIIAWNALLQAILQQRGTDYFESDDAGRPVMIDGRPKVLDTWELMNLAIGGTEKAAMRANLAFFLRLRHLVAHRYLPAVDAAVVAEAQALLLNLEKVLAESFGSGARLGNRLAVPLQLSEFYTFPGSKTLKESQTRLPADVMDFLNRHRKELPEEIVRSSEYALQIFFVPVAANRERAADAVVRFIKPEDVTPEMEKALQQIAVVIKPKRIPVASDDLILPSEVVRQVAARIPFRFTLDTHTRCWRYFRVRPATGSTEPSATDSRYCLYDSLSSRYGYTKAWVEKLVRDLTDPETYEALVGYRPSGQVR